MLKPLVSMSEVYGDGHLFMQRAHPDYADWLSSDPSILDMMAGGGLGITGSMPAICSRGSVTPRFLELLELAGVPVTADRILFGSGQELEALSDAVEHRSETIVLQHAYPAGALPDERLWIDPELLSDLNNKGELGRFVATDNLPDRTVADRRAYFAGEPSPPIVLKAVTRQSTGGGKGVAVCHDRAGLKDAETLFGRCEKVVAERFLDIADNPCLNFAAWPDGTITYVGFAEQDVTSEGKHRGNWIDLEARLPQAVVDAAAEPVRRAASLGYRGLAGVDVAITRDGRILVLDLNFRINASTPGLLLGPAIRDRQDDTILHFRRMRGDLGAERLADALTPFVNDGRIVPITMFDADAAGYDGKPSIALVLIAGRSRDAVLATEQEIAALGID